MFNRSWAGVTVVVGGSCDLCPIFSCSQSTWSSTLVYTPKAEASWLKDSNLSKICHLACHHVGHSHSLQSSRFPEEPLTRYSCLCVINERGRYTKKYHYPPLSHWSWWLKGLLQNLHCRSQPPRLGHGGYWENNIRERISSGVKYCLKKK